MQKNPVMQARFGFELHEMDGFQSTALSQGQRYPISICSFVARLVCKKTEMMRRPRPNWFPHRPMHSDIPRLGFQRIDFESGV